MRVWLLCPSFLGLVALIALPTAASEWFHREDVDRFTDEVTHSMHIESLDRHGGLFDLSCTTERGVSAMLIWFRPEYRMQGEQIELEWRAGARPRGLARWRGLQGWPSLHDNSNAQVLIDDILAGEAESTSLIVRARGNLLEFDVAGFGEAYAELVARCFSGRS